MTAFRPHIIAANTPSGMNSQRRPSAFHSAGSPEARQAATPFDETRRAIEAAFNADDRPNLYRDIVDEEEGADELVAEWRESIDADLRIIGYGLLVGMVFVVVLFQLAQLGWL